MEKIELNNTLIYYGDNLKILSSIINEYRNKIDLIYIDPPYGTGNDFHIDGNNTKTISKSRRDNIAYSDKLIGEVFIKYVTERIKLSYDFLTDSGTIYVHIGNQYASYIEIELDKIFGMNNRISKITRIKCNPKNSKIKSYGNVYDTILVYAKKKGKHIWNDVKFPYTEEEVVQRYKKKDSNGYYTTIPLHAPGETKEGQTGQKWKNIYPPKGRHWRTRPDIMDEWDKQGLIEWSKNGNPRKKKYVHENSGKKIQDVWEFKDYTNHYPTEKNLDMLNLIIKMSSKVDSYILDFFAGSGTTGVAALLNKRKPILVDSSKEAIEVIKRRINELD